MLIDRGGAWWARLVATVVALTTASALVAIEPSVAERAPSHPLGSGGVPAVSVRQHVVVLLRTAEVTSDQTSTKATVVVRSTAPHGLGTVVLRADGHLLARGKVGQARFSRLKLAVPQLSAGTHAIRAVYRSRGAPARYRSNIVEVNTLAGCSGKPSSCGYGDASNTGPAPGTVFTSSGSLTITQPGTVVNGLDIRGTLTIAASNVTVKNTKVRGNAFSIVTVKDNVTGVVIENVSVDGMGTSGTDGSFGISGGSPRILNTEVSGVENGFVPGSGSSISHSYVHDLSSGGAPHYDGIQIDGGLHDIAISGTTVDVTEHDQTSAVMVDNYFGPINNIQITGNLLMGGGYTMYADGAFSSSRPITNVTYANNRLGKGYWGYSLIRGASVSWSGNIDNSTARAIGPNK